MGFKDRLLDDTDKVFLGHGHFEENLVYTYADGTTVNIKGIVDLLSLDTGGMAENEVNPGISSLADIAISQNDIPLVSKYDKIISEDGKKWRIIQRQNEGGMWQIRCTSEQKRRR